MKSAVETVDATKVKLTVEVPYDELKPSIDHAYEHIAQQVDGPRLPQGQGPAAHHRPARRPPRRPRARDQRRHVRASTARPCARTRCARSASREIEVTQVPGLTPTPARTSLHFTAEVEVRPEIEIPALDGIDASRSTTSRSPTRTSRAASTRCASASAPWSASTARPPRATSSSSTSPPRSATSRSTRVSGVSYQIGSGNMLEGLDEALTGLSAGETTTFEPRRSRAASTRARRPTVSVTATSVKQRDLPAADDDFAQLASEFDTLEELTRRPARAGRRRQDVEPGRPGPRRAARAAARGRSRSPSRRASSRPRCTVTSSPRAASRTTSTAPRSPSRRPTALRNQILLDTLAEKLEIQVEPERAARVPGERVAPVRHGPEHVHPDGRRAGPDPAMVAEVARSKALAVALRQVAVDGRRRQRRSTCPSSSAPTPRTPRTRGAPTSGRRGAADEAAADVAASARARAASRSTRSTTPTPRTPRPETATRHGRTQAPHRRRCGATRPAGRRTSCGAARPEPVRRRPTAPRAPTAKTARSRMGASVPRVRVAAQRVERPVGDGPSTTRSQTRELW